MDGMLQKAIEENKARNIAEAASLNGKRIMWRFKGAQAVDDLRFRRSPSVQHIAGTPLVWIVGDAFVRVDEIEYFVLPESSGTLPRVVDIPNTNVAQQSERV